uniref:Uncharacterized protein n=1 Tax=Salmonella phage vB_SEnST11_KE23 TaxID=3161174 RepID=A0AAU8GHE1_9CAUD
MKEHKFKIEHDKKLNEWCVYVEVPFLFFWKIWRPVPKQDHGTWWELIFNSEQECMKGIEKWKIENAPGYRRYATKEIMK